ncbi:MAG: hypothetical protein JWR51_4701 [Devosia sp.]|uniref:hypothetical protein n=1 Tax=Devosia sp. TaxID=1871048 RepID=UPI00262FF881|nr:hypothetical protein [Devosia sp.]MDB5531598.1 hypothetical protein [Devosia sp.]
MNAAAETITETATIYDLALESLEAESGDVRAAAKRLGDRLLSDADLLSSVLEDVIQVAVSKVLDSKNIGLRRRIWRSEANGPASVIALANGIFNSMYDFPLAGGVKLGDATKDQVLAQANSYGTVIQDISVKRRFMLAVADKLTGPAVKVRDVLSEDELRTLKSGALK